VKPYRGAQYHREIELGTHLFKHKEHIRNALQEHGKEVTDELENVIRTGTRTGRVYWYAGRQYTASAPGEPPANRSGRLASSFEHKARQYDLAIGNTAFSDRGFPYPSHLEDNMNRPYFVKTINRLHGRLMGELQNAEL